MRLLTFLLLVFNSAFAEDTVVKAFTAAPLVRQGKFSLGMIPAPSKRSIFDMASAERIWPPSRLSGLSTRT